MSSMTLLSAIGDVRDPIVEESFLLFEQPARVLCPKGQSVIARFFGSGWGVAVICAAVSLSVLAGIIRAGNPPAGGPAGTGGPVESECTVTEPPTEPAEPDETETEKSVVKPPQWDYNGQYGANNGGYGEPPRVEVPTAKVPMVSFPTVDIPDPTPPMPSVPLPNVPTPGPTPMP